ncbi:MAG: MarR family transcriptional regulator [Aggregatilineales bacterium]
MMKIYDHELTNRQIEILSFIYDYQTDYGFVPSIREICEATGIRSTSAVSYQINRLVRSGYINKVGEVSRGMILMAPAYDVIGKQAPHECDLSVLRSELFALRLENRRIREQYETRVKNLEHERNQLSQTLAMLKYRVIKQLEGVFEEELAS